MGAQFVSTCINPLGVKTKSSFSDFLYCASGNTKGYLSINDAYTLQNLTQAANRSKSSDRVLNRSQCSILIPNSPILRLQLVHDSPEYTHRVTGQQGNTLSSASVGLQNKKHTIRLPSYSLNDRWPFIPFQKGLLFPICVYIQIHHYLIIGN